MLQDCELVLSDARMNAIAGVMKRKSCEFSVRENLEIDFQRELKRPRIVRRCGLPGRARTRNRIAERVDVAPVETVQHIESVRDDLQVETFRDRNRSRNTQIDLEKSGTRERVAAKRAGAAEEWRGYVGK